MKKVTSSLSKRFPSVILYREDIEEIHNLFKEFCNDVDLVSNGYKFETIDELIENQPGNIKDLDICSKEPYVSVSFSKGLFSIRLYASSGKDSELLFYKVSELIEKRKKFLSIVLNKTVGWISFYSFLILMPLIFYIPKEVLQKYFQYPFQLFALLFLPIIIAYSSYLFTSGNLYTLTLVSKNKTSFFQRNKDQILLIIFSVAFGSLVTMLLGRYFNH